MNKPTKNPRANRGIAAPGALINSCTRLVASNIIRASHHAQVCSTSGPKAPCLGMAVNFVVFAGSKGISNQGLKTVITGNIGTTGASDMITGFHCTAFSYSETPFDKGIVNGIVVSDAPQGSAEEYEIAKAVSNDALSAYNFLATVPDGMDPRNGRLGGLTLAPGAYTAAAGSFFIAGCDLTLDAQGNSAAVWVFQMENSLTVGDAVSARSVLLINGAQAKNVFWQLGGTATINAKGGGIMAGTIIAGERVVFSTPGTMTESSLNGRAFSLFGAVSMVNTVIAANDIPVW